MSAPFVKKGKKTGQTNRAFPVSFLFFILAVVGSFHFYLLAQRHFQAIEAQRFERDSDKAFSRIREHIELCQSVLYGVRGFFAASRTVERGEWETFLGQYELKRRYPGIASIRFIERVAGKDKETFLQGVRAEGSPGFDIHPAGSREEYAVVKFVEPVEGFRTRLGADLAMDPLRKKALEEARDRGDFSVTRGIFIRTDNAEEAGFSVYLPFYRIGAPVSTTGERRDALAGYVSAVFKNRELFASIFSGQEFNPALHFEIYAGPTVKRAHLIYSRDKSAHLLDPLYSPRFLAKKSLAIGGERWRIYFMAQSVFDAGSAERRLPFVLFVLGCLFGLFISGILYSSLVVVRQRKEISVAEKALADEREERLRAELEEAKKREEEIRRLNEELELRVMERTAELEAFSYSVSHDLRSPLIAINGFTSALLEDYGARLDEEARAYLSKVTANSKNMGALIDDLLAFSRLSRQAMTFGDRIDMGALAREVFDEFCRNLSGRDIEFRVKALPMIKGDRSMIRQVWQNLLSNAVKYTRGKPKAVIEVGSYAKDGENVFYVKDNGAGFDMEYRHKLFQVFQRLHSRDRFEGTGVGLAIVQRVLSRHGGHVWAEGKEGEGATFYFAVPTEPHFRERDEAWLTSMKSRSS
jgi:signal transduction histidine kinase